MTCAEALPAEAPVQLGTGAQAGNATPYIYVDGDLRYDFRLSADLYLPDIPSNTGLFYTDWLLLLPHAQGLQPFVQIETMRWKRYGYRPEVAYTWTQKDGRLVYQDSQIFLDDGKPHTFFIGVHKGTIGMGVDGRTLCTGLAANFFANTAPLFYQVGGEVEQYGDRLDGTVANLQLKSDHDLAPVPIVSRCGYQDRGTAWTYIANGSYQLGGRLVQNAPSAFYGFVPDEPCVVPLFRGL